MSETIKEMEAALELYRHAIDSGQITKDELDRLPGGAGLFASASFKALDVMKELDPSVYPQRLEYTLRISRLRFPRIEQK